MTYYGSLCAEFYDVSKKFASDEEISLYSDLNVTEVEQQCHDKRTYKIGNVLIRIPTAESYAFKESKEQELLTKLAKDLSISIPAPIKMGTQSDGYSYPFSIYKDNYLYIDSR